MEYKTMNILDTAELYRIYQLNLDKINSIDDIKKILDFLCKLSLKPTPEGIEYNGFENVRDYFE